jgi:ABC-type amino acid transport substrate-binding protein
MRGKALVLCCALLLSTTACATEESDDAIPKFDPETTLAGQIQQRGTLVVGVEENLAPWSSESGDGEPEGFTVEIGRWIAEGLGVEVEFEIASTQELASMTSEGTVDVAFPLMPITEAGLENHLFTDPYFVSHQRFLVPAGSGIEDVSDLSNKRVCQYIFEDTGVDVRELNPQADVFDAVDPSDCLASLEDGETDAISASDFVLIALAASSPDDVEIVGEQLSTEAFGGLTINPALGFNGFIDSVFAEAESEGRWSGLYEHWIGPLSENPQAEPPALTMEQAAALNPAGLK